MNKLQKNWIVLFEKTILVNDCGYYFDFIISNFKEHYIDINMLDPNSSTVQIILYPTKNQIIEYLEQIKTSHAVIVLNEYQKDERDILKIYFRETYVEFNQRLLLEYLGISFFTMSELFEQAKSKDYIRFLYVYLTIKEEFNLNPSYLHNINNTNWFVSLIKKDFEKLNAEKYPLTYKYLSCVKEIDTATITHALFYDLTKFQDNKINFLIEFLKQENIYEVYEKDLEVGEEIIEECKRDAIIFTLKPGNLRLLFMKLENSFVEVLK